MANIGKNVNAPKVALITGANRGLGFETARELGELGLTVVLGCRDLAKGEVAAHILKEKGIDAYALHYDASDAGSKNRVFDFFESRYGHLDILVNNAGFVSPEESMSDRGNVETVPVSVIEETFAVNVFAVVDLTQTLLPLLKKSEAGRIVNVSSRLGSLTVHSDPQSGMPATGVFAYCASKTALNAFTVHLAKALEGTKVKVNSAHPGWVKTDLGGPNAPMEIGMGGKTSAELATLPDDGPTGGFFHRGKALPW